jgi:hypothetical protein
MPKLHRVVVLCIQSVDCRGRTEVVYRVSPNAWVSPGPGNSGAEPQTFVCTSPCPPSSASVLGLLQRRCVLQLLPGLTSSTEESERWEHQIGLLDLCPFPDTHSGSECASSQSLWESDQSGLSHLPTCGVSRNQNVGTLSQESAT